MPTSSRHLVGVVSLLVVAALPLSLAGCGERTPSPGSFSARDSAGIRIAESLGPVYPPGEGWELSSEPVLQIGAVEGEDPYLFTEITGALRLDDGRIVVCDAGDNTIRFFDPAGEFLFLTGGTGEGPTEFRHHLYACERVAEGIVGIQLRASPNKVFDLDANLRRSFRRPPIRGGPSEHYGTFSDGTVLAGSEEPPHRGKPGVWDTALRLSLVSPDGLAKDSVVDLTWYRWAASADRTTFQAFGPWGQLYVAGDEIFYGWPEDYEIAVYDRDFQPRRRIRRAWEPAPVTDADRDFYESLMLGGDGSGLTPVVRRARQRTIDIMVYPEHRPAFDRIHVDREGYLWVRRFNSRRNPFSWLPTVYRIEPTWDVFDPTGMWITTLTLPEAFAVRDIGEDFVLGAWKDEFDVEYVQLYRLSRKG